MPARAGNKRWAEMPVQQKKLIAPIITVAVVLQMQAALPAPIQVIQTFRSDATFGRF